ncbi:flagellar hook-associated family protein [Cohaesibacter celericrescens]|uniref:Flagellin n=1 Tax=Cohaesibacter celericrescens TaxID=2067669 RepID=A0A2N5XLV9_9HYPH|nr:flagellar hook-associated family protein [Cohaesibacter celericrescens]PLW75521.1 flagellar hook protein FliD [Cohaesibacter celericrescens]PLW78928.1 flagellar hook protein FliD [Cohaesibacter celericrescens]
MKTGFISTLSLTSASRGSIMEQSVALAKLQTEVSSGRKYDVGLDLGIGTGEAISMRSEFENLNTIVDTNGLVKSRLDVTETGMLNVRDSAQTMLATLVSSIGSETGREVTIAEAKNNLEQLVATLNTSFSGTYLFAGINVGETPITDYYATGSANKTAVDTTFMAEFGMAQNNAGLNSVTAAQMQSYLDGAFANEFDSPGNWNANWSTATDQEMVNRISTSETIETSISANIDPMRKLAMAFTMVADLGGENMTQNTFDVVLNKAVSMLGEAIGELNSSIGQVGNAQARVARASDKLSLQTDLINERILALENVNTTEVSVLLSNAVTQLEVTYAVTSRMQGMSLLNYL